MRSKSVFLIAVLLTPVSFVSMAFPQTQKSGSDAVAEVTRLQQESVKADLANDPSFVKQHYAEDYTSGSSWGISDTKASVLKDMSDLLSAQRLASGQLHSPPTCPLECHLHTAHDSLQ